MNARLCVTNIGFRVTEEHLREYFSRFGRLSECKLKIDATTGDSRGFAFITYTDMQSQQRCLQTTSHRIEDRAVTVFADVQETNFKVPRSKKLFISLLGIRGVSELDLFQVFSDYGEIASIEFDKSEEAFDPQFCILYFRDYQSVDNCLLRSHCIHGRQVYTRRATSREEVKLAEQRERELQAAKAQAKKVYGVHCPTKNVTIVQPRLFSSMPSMTASSGPSTAQTESRKRTFDQSSSGFPKKSSHNSGLNGYGYI